MEEDTKERGRGDSALSLVQRAARIIELEFKVLWNCRSAAMSSNRAIHGERPVRRSVAPNSVAA